MTRCIARPSRRGRPRDPAKRDALLGAALEQFLALGPRGPAMDEIAARAGVSKATLYSNFPDRDALLEAVIRRESHRIISDGYLLEARELDFKTALERFGERLLTFLVDPRRAALERLIMAAVENHADLARRFFAAGPGRSRGILIELIVRGTRQGIIRANDAQAAAEDLIGLWWGVLRLEIALGIRKVPPAAEIRRRSARAVAQFIRLYGAAAT